MRGKIVFLILFLVTYNVIAEATIQGVVLDGKSGMAFSGESVVIYISEDRSKPYGQTVTDEKGFYLFRVEPGFYYDVYVRKGEPNPNQRTKESVKEDRVYTLNFNIIDDSTYTSLESDSNIIWIIGAFAGIVILTIVYDMFFGGKKNPSKKDLENERDELKRTINLAREKYHKRELDEESFRNIISAQQTKIIEIEAKIGNR